MFARKNRSQSTYTITPARRFQKERQRRQHLQDSSRCSPIRTIRAHRRHIEQPLLGILFDLITQRHQPPRPAPDDQAMLATALDQPKTIVKGRRGPMCARRR